MYFTCYRCLVVCVCAGIHSPNGAAATLFMKNSIIYDLKKAEMRTRTEKGRETNKMLIAEKQRDACE